MGKINQNRFGCTGRIDSIEMLNDSCHIDLFWKPYTDQAQHPDIKPFRIHGIAKGRLGKIMFQTILVGQYIYIDGAFSPANTEIYFDYSQKSDVLVTTYYVVINFFDLKNTAPTSVVWEVV